MPIWIPEKCLRGLDDCTALAQIESDDGQSFWCCGHNDAASRSEPQDRFRLCFKNAVMDEMSDLDDADMKDLGSVISQALSVDEHMSRDDTTERTEG